MGHKRNMNRPTDNTPPASPLQLVPDLRDRLQARLVAMDIAADQRASHVAMLTQRSVQSVRRWFDARRPGLPDLESFARLCAGLGCSADALLGSTPDQPTQVVAVAEAIHAMADTLRARGSLGQALRVPGDEMAPQLCAGDLVFIDAQAEGPLDGGANGVYALMHGVRLLIRRIEHCPGDRLLLTCDNRHYRDWELPRAAAAEEGLRILGRVQAAIGLRTF